MFATQYIAQRTPCHAGLGAFHSNFRPGLDLPFMLVKAGHDPAAALAGEGREVELARFASLPEAMEAVLAVAEAGYVGDREQVLAILDRDQRLVLAGVVQTGAVAWCQPVLSVLEARQVVTEASQMRAAASRAVSWNEPALAHRLRHGAELLEARLVDPLWRQFAARALQLAA